MKEIVHKDARDRALGVKIRHPCSREGGLGGLMAWNVPRMDPGTGESRPEKDRPGLI